MHREEHSERLHRRVRAYVHDPERDERFEELALDIARFQAQHSAAYARLVEHSGSDLRSLDAIPAVPSEAFRLARVAVHPPEFDVVRFETSGTSESARGIHPFRTTRTYEEVALRFGRCALLRSNERVTAVALAACPQVPWRSSLGFMMELFMRELDGRTLLGAAFAPADPARYLLSGAGPDLLGLRQAADVANARGEPLLLLATSLALAALLETLDGNLLPLPHGSVVMHTGGSKGQYRKLDAEQLRGNAASAFRIPRAALVGEYGMTELSSQLYEPTLPGGELELVLRSEPVLADRSAVEGAAPIGQFLAPPWLCVSAVDPATLLPLPDGQLGLGRFVDLANVDSALSVLTRDRVRRRGALVELFGREPGAPPRGCSLAVDALLGPKHER